MLKIMADRNKIIPKEIKIGFQTDSGREIIPEIPVTKLKRYGRYKIQLFTFMLF